MKSSKITAGVVILVVLLVSDIVKADPDEDIPHNE